jgi:hypothetical protein
MYLCVGLALLAVCAVMTTAVASDPKPLPVFDRVVIDESFPGGYQVEVADVNGDGRLDVVGLGGNTCAWYENPTWKKRVVTTAKQTPGIISSATADLDGDGQAEIAIGYEFALDRPTRGELLLASRKSADQAAWKLAPIGPVGSIHRLRWGDVDGDKQPDLVVAPIVGLTAAGPAYDQSPAGVLVYRGATRPKAEGQSWESELAGKDFVLHAIKVLDFDGDGRSEVLLAGNQGVTLCGRDPQSGSWSATHLTPGAPGKAPKRGSSEIQVGRLADGTRFLVTIDPWHGTEVAVSLAKGPHGFGPRTVIDSSLRDGHALWVADVDGDGDDEIFAGFRGPGTSVLGYDFDGKAWKRSVVDPAIAAQDLRGGDIDADGRPDFVAIGGATHNIVWYRPRLAPR